MYVSKRITIMIKISTSGFFFLKRLVHNLDAAVQYSDDDNKKNAQLQDGTGGGCKYTTTTNVCFARSKTPFKTYNNIMCV